MYTENPHRSADPDAICIHILELQHKECIQKRVQASLQIQEYVYRKGETMLHQLAYALAQKAIYCYENFWTDYTFQHNVVRAVMYGFILATLMVAAIWLLFHEKKANKNSD